MAKLLTINPEADKDEAIKILVNLREREGIYQEHFGSLHKENVKYWQQKADKWIEDNTKPVIE